MSFPSVMIQDCIRPSGRVRIETWVNCKNLHSLVDCIRPSGRVRIETLHRWILVIVRQPQALHPAFWPGED